MDRAESIPAARDICRRGVASSHVSRHRLCVTIKLELCGVQFEIPVATLRGRRAQLQCRQHSQSDCSLPSAGSLTSQGLDTKDLSEGSSANACTDEAVIELRRRLSAFSGAQPSETSVATLPDGAVMPAVSLSPAAQLEQSGEIMDDACLLRWLTARHRDVDIAERDLRAHAAWRVSYIPRGRVFEEEVRNEIATQKAFLQGCDHQGRPVLIVLARRHDMSARVPEETNRFIVYSLDSCAAATADANTSALNPLGKFLCLFDLSGLRMNNLDIKALQGVFALLQGHFPERLSQLWFLNAPFIFWGLWRCVSPFIEPATRDKIVFLSGAQRAARLQETIPREVLPLEYGGVAQMIPVDKAVAARREAAAAAAAVARLQQPQEQARGPHHRRRSIAERPVGHLQAPQRWASAGWGYLKRGATATVHVIKLPSRHLPALPRPSFGWPGWTGRHAGNSRKVDGEQPHSASLALVRQHSLALQRRVASSMPSSVSSLYVILAPVLHPAVFLLKVWQQARQVARWAWSKSPSLRTHPRQQPSPPRQPPPAPLAHPATMTSDLQSSS